MGCVIANDTDGWGNLCEFITAARTTELPKGEYRVSWEHSDVPSLQHCQILFVPDRPSGGAVDAATLHEDLIAAKTLFGGNLWLSVEMLNELDDDLWFVTLVEAGERGGVPLVAAGDVHMLTCTRAQAAAGCAHCRARRQDAGRMRLRAAVQRRAHLRQRVRLAGLYTLKMLANTTSWPGAAASIPR